MSVVPTPEAGSVSVLGASGTGTEDFGEKVYVRSVQRRKKMAEIRANVSVERATLFLWQS